MHDFRLLKTSVCYRTTEQKLQSISEDNINETEIERKLLLSRKISLEKAHKSTTFFKSILRCFHPRKINDPRIEISYKKNVEKSRS
jgi:hypothetical protein